MMFRRLPHQENPKKKTKSKKAIDVDASPKATSTNSEEEINEEGPQNEQTNPVGKPKMGASSSNQASAKVAPVSYASSPVVAAAAAPSVVVPPLASAAIGGIGVGAQSSVMLVPMQQPQPLPLQQVVIGGQTYFVMQQPMGPSTNIAPVVVQGLPSNAVVPQQNKQEKKEEESDESESSEDVVAIKVSSKKQKKNKKKKKEVNETAEDVEAEDLYKTKGRNPSRDRTAGDDETPMEGQVTGGEGDTTHEGEGTTTGGEGMGETKGNGQDGVDNNEWVSYEQMYQKMTKGE